MEDSSSQSFSGRATSNFDPRDSQSSTTISPSSLPPCSTSYIAEFIASNPRHLSLLFEMEHLDKFLLSSQLLRSYDRGPSCYRNSVHLGFAEPF